MFHRTMKYFFFPFVALIAIGIVGLKLLTLFVFPAWDRWVSVGLLVFSALAISKLLIKSIRLRIAEYMHKRGGELQILPPLGKGSALPLSSMILVGVLLPLVVFSGLGVSAYLIRQHVQESAMLSCGRKLPPLPRVSNDVPNVSLEAYTSNQSRTWQHSSLGKNEAIFSYLDKGYQDNHAISVTIRHYRDGSASWFYPLTPAQAGITYHYSDWYQSSNTSSLIMKYLLNGQMHYQTIDKSIPSTQEWRHYSVSFDIPATEDVDMIPVSIMHALTATGTLTIDRMALHPAMGAFMRPLISFTFDDGWKSQYTNGLPLLCKYKIPATFYLVSSYLQGYPDYLNFNQARDMIKKGEEIGGHTVDHRDLAVLYPDFVTWELSVSQEMLRRQFGQKIENFAAPYGSVNDKVLHQIRHYYSSHRGVETGLNNPEDFDPYNIQCITYTKDMTLSQMEAFVDQAIKTNTWLVFAFHQIDDSSSPYAATPQFFEQLLQYVDNHKRIQPMTMEQALTEVREQI